MNSTSVIIVTDSRCGDSRAFNTLSEFRAAMIDCGWRDEEFDNFMNMDADVHEADLAFPGIYVYENGQYIYYTVFEDGTVKYRGAFDAPVHAATELE